MVLNKMTNGGGTVREKRPTVMKGISFLFILIAVVVGLIFAASTLRSEKGPKVAQDAPVPISVATISADIAATFSLAETYTGMAEARRKSQLGFSTGGRIQSISVDVGDKVKAGASLARLDTRGLNAQLLAAEASVEETRAAHALALNTVERQRTLQSQGHVSQQRVDEAEAQANTGFARIEAAKSQADTLRVQIDLARITAPYAGVVTQRMSDEGAIAGPGAPILELVETSVLEARIGVPAANAARLTPGTLYTLRADTGPVQAKLRSVTGVIDPTRRTVMTVFEISEPGVLPSGAVVRLALDRDVGEDGFWVPVKAMSAGVRGLWSVYVAEPDADRWRVAARPVEIVHSEGDRAFVRGTVKPDDKIIIDGLQRLTPGMLVIPRDSVRAQADADG